MHKETTDYPSNKISESSLFRKYKSSYTSAFIDLTTHSILLSLSFYSLWYFRNSWLSVFTTTLLGLLNVKTFIIFHDCGHGSYTPSKSLLNYVIGIITGIIITTPFSWNYNHHTHHLVSGNVENEYDYPYNETIFHSLHQYKSFSPMKRHVYKFIRHPYFFFTIVPIFKFLVVHRFNSFRLMKKKMSMKDKNVFIMIEQVINNVGIFVLFNFLYKHGILFHYLVVSVIGSSCGVMLFHSQHGFNPPYIVDNSTFNQKDSGLIGSSFIQIPYWLRYFTGSIEYHHIHHMNAKIPNYNLRKYHETVISTSNMFDNIVKLSMSDCYDNLWLVLYDEEKRRFITFAEADEEIQENKFV